MDYRTKCFHYKGEQCVECGSQEDVEAHHIDSNRWNNQIDNLVPLCHDCHMKVHNGHPDVEHWTERLDPEPYNGEPTDEEINQAFEDAGLN